MKVGDLIIDKRWPEDSAGLIVSIGDLVKARLSELEAEKEALVEYITHGG